MRSGYFLQEGGKAKVFSSKVRNIKRKPPKPEGFRGFGAASQIRTGDLILTKDALYLLSYSSISIDSFHIISASITVVNLFFCF